MDIIRTVEFRYPTSASEAGDQAIAQVATTLRQTQ